MILIYLLINKNNNGYDIKAINWLNWIHNISGSLENSYALMSKFNNNTKRSHFSKTSDAACYKALYPILTFLPKKSSNGLTNISLFEILRVFVKSRKIKFTRDFARNVYSRIRTNLKFEYNIDHVDAIQIIKNKELVNIEYKGQINIPNTVLKKNIIQEIDNDKFLLSIIDYTI